MEHLKRILIGVTGSVAAIKIPELISNLLDTQKSLIFEIKVIITDKAEHFLNLSELSYVAQVHQDSDEWQTWSKRGDPVLHIELTKWADLFVISPLDANTLAKMANGLCDNLLLCTVRAWDLKKPIIFAPAMNTRMWEHPCTEHQIKKLKSWGYQEIPCIAKALMCGDTGMGAMATTDEITEKIIQCFST